jgi:HAD superfamily hydrolase (TIGR01509 family)
MTDTVDYLLRDIGDPREIHGVALDIGGVLLSWAYGKYRRLQEDWPPALMDAAWEARLGLQPGDFVRRVWSKTLHAQATTGAIPFAQYWRTVGQQLGLTSQELDELWEDYWVISRLDPAVAETVRALRPHYKVAALSNAFSNARTEVARRFALDELVDLMVISGEVGYAKPDPRIYELLLWEMDMEASHVLFVDDVEDNVLAARELGMRATRSTSTASFLRVLDLLR